MPGLWLFAMLATAVVLGSAAVIAPRLLRERDSVGPPVVAVAATPVLLAPWLLPLLTTGSASGLLLEAGRLTVDQVTFGGLVTGRLNDLGAPMWFGVVLGLLALVALIPRRTRVPVLICWLVALAAAVVSGLLSHVTLDLREEARSQKRTKFGGFKYVYPREPMREMRDWFDAEIARVLPMARILYWT